MFVKNFLENTASNCFSFLKNCVSYYTLPLFTFGMKTFIYYKQIETDVTVELKKLYRTNYAFHSICNFIHFFPHLIDAELFEYKTQPMQESWIDTILYYQGSNKEIVLKEDYDTFPFQNNLNDLQNIIQVKLSIFEKWDIINIDNVKSLHLLKCRDKYICKIDPKIFAKTNLDIKPVSNPFLEIIYKNLDDNTSQEVDIPKSYFYDNNDILSCVFLKRYFDYRSTPQNFHFSKNYVIVLTNFNMEEECLYNNQYIHLGNNKYSIQTQ